MKIQSIFTGLLMLIINLTLLGQAEKQGTFEYKKATIIHLDVAQGTLQVDVPQKQKIITLQLKEGITQFQNKKGKNISSDDFWVGTSINITGYIDKDRAQIPEKLNLLTKVNDWKITAKGILEEANGHRAIIDGHQVFLEKDGVIKGVDNLKGQTFNSFEAIEPGCFVSIKGKRNKDGSISTSNGTAEMNHLSPLEVKLHNTVAQNFNGDSILSFNSTPQLTKQLGTFNLPVNNLYKGNISVGGLKFKLVEDYKVQGYVNKVGNKLIPAYMQELPDNHENKINFRFYVVDNPVFNAFAFPDGSVFVNTGLLAVIENEAQLASILAHEIAHVTHEHGKKRMGSQVWVKTAVTAAIIGVNAVSATKLDNNAKAMISSLVTIGGTGFLAFYGRKHEEQSDRVGLYYMEKAGYDPRESAAVWARLQTVTGKTTTKEKLTNSFEALLKSNESYVGENPFSQLSGSAINILSQKLLTPLYSSHPKVEKRYHSLNQLVATNYRDTNFDKLTKGDKRYKTVVHQLYQGLLKP